MKILQMIPMFIAAVCVGTVAVEGAGAVYMWSNGQLSADHINQVVEVMYGVDAEAVHEELTYDSDEEDAHQPSFDEILELRSLARLDLELREMSGDKALIEQATWRSLLTNEKQQYIEMEKEFESRRKEFEGTATDPALLEVQRTLVALPAKQAKDQLLRMLDDDALQQSDEVMNDVVAIIKSMPIDKRKKIFAEFKTDIEQKQLGDILRHIRLGVPSVDLIRRTRQQLRQFEHQNSIFQDTGGQQ